MLSLAACNGSAGSGKPSGDGGNEQTPSGGGGTEQTPPGGTEDDPTKDPSDDKDTDEGGGTTPSKPDRPTSKPTVDMSGVSFQNAVFTYDGEEHSIFVSGTLPEGVTVTYTGNGKVNAGYYNVTAKFTVPEGYQSVPVMRAVMDIFPPDEKEGFFTYVNAEKDFVYNLRSDYDVPYLVIPDGVERLADKAIFNRSTLKYLYVPASVTEIGAHAFGFISDKGLNRVAENFVVYGEAGSAAEAYCTEHGITFKSEALPRVYTSAEQLSDDYAHLADLVSYYGLDLAKYGMLFDPQLASAADAVAAFDRDTGKAAVLKALDEQLLLRAYIDVTVDFVDESGKTIAESVSYTVRNGSEFTVKTPAVFGYYRHDIYEEFVASMDGSCKVFYRKIPSSADTQHIQTLLPDFVCWGDSITAGAWKSDLTTAKANGVNLTALGSTADGANYVDVVKKLIQFRVFNGIKVTNCGVGGETAAVVAARAGAESYRLYIENTVTLSGASVPISIAQNATNGRLGILRQGGGNSVNDVQIVGYTANGVPITVTGRIELALAPGAPSDTNIQTCDYNLLRYTFIRTDSGTETVTFREGATIVTSGSYLYDGRICIIFIGQNGGYGTPAELIKQQEEIIASCEAKDYIIISTHSGTTASRKALNDALTVRWGDRYINMGTELSSEYAYRLAGLSDRVIEKDAECFETGKVSDIFLRDGVHGNALGYAVIGNIIFERMAELGYFEAVYDYYDSLN